MGANDLLLPVPEEMALHIGLMTVTPHLNNPHPNVPSRQYAKLKNTIQVEVHMLKEKRKEKCKKLLPSTSLLFLDFFVALTLREQKENSPSVEFMNDKKHYKKIEF